MNWRPRNVLIAVLLAGVLFGSSGCGLVTGRRVLHFVGGQVGKKVFKAIKAELTRDKKDREEADSDHADVRDPPSRRPDSSR